MYQHNGVKQFKCDQCEKSFESSNRLRKHIKQHNGYKCNKDSCDFVAYKWTDLQKHVASKHKEIHKCVKCNKEFDEGYNLTRHMKIHSGERLVCNFNESCKKTYTNERNLKQHIRIDHEGKFYK